MRPHIDRMFSLMFIREKLDVSLDIIVLVEKTIKNFGSQTLDISYYGCNEAKRNAGELRS